MGQLWSSTDIASQSPQADCFCKTRVNVSELTFNWEIENLSHSAQQTGEELLSETFSMEDSNDIWCLMIYVRGWKKESKDCVSLFLKLVESNRENVGAKYTFLLKSSKDEHSFAGTQLQHTFDKNGAFWGWDQFMKRSFLLDPKNGLLPDDKFTIVCSLAVTGDTVSFGSQPGPAMSGSGLSSEPATFSAHQTNLAKLLSSEKLSDCTLKVGGKQFKAHKAILSAHSSVFSAMFEHRDTRESQTGHINIEDTDPEVMKELLQFIYTGSAPNVKSMADRLMVLADKYHLEPLKGVCEESICEQLSVENACAILVQADRLSATRLKSHAVKFVIAQADEVSKSEGFKSLGEHHPQLLIETFQAMAGPQAKRKKPNKQE